MIKNYKNFFKNKKITVMGLGILGRGLGYTKFMAECGADLIVTDLKTKKELANSIKKLEKFKNIKFVLGKHRVEDFRNKDMIIKSAGVPLDSLFIIEAHKNKIPIEMDVSLFSKLAPEATIVGVTGTRGKSMTTALIYEILKRNEKSLKRKIYLGGNMRGVATLPLLKKITKGDIVVCELDSWQLQGFGDSKMSPHISVFTSFMPDHMNYYHGDMKKYFSDKANIFKYQKKGDYLIVRPEVKKFLPKKVKNKVIVVKKGTFQEENKACAMEVAKLFGISRDNTEKALQSFKGLEGRLQYVKAIKGVRIYNDNNATTPEATIAGLEILGTRNTIMISGGADKGLNLKNLEKKFKECKAVVLIPGTGTDRLGAMGKRVKTLKEAIKGAMKLAEKGDIVLFSPAFASFGPPPSGFKNEYDRNDQFMKIINKYK